MFGCVIITALRGNGSDQVQLKRFAINDDD